MRFVLLFLLSLVFGLPHPLFAQGDPPKILVGAVPRLGWEHPAIADVRFGRLAVVESPGESRLELRRLSAEAPVGPSVDGRSWTPPLDGNNLIVADFSKGNRTPLGGYFGTFQREPSAARATVRPDSEQRRILEVSCDQQDPGFCGLWIQLYDLEISPSARPYLDARPFSTLSLWVRGQAGGERVLLKLADADWERREDALPLGEVARFLPSGKLGTEWQQAVIPLDDFLGQLRMEQLAQVVFEVLDPGATTIEIGPVAFSIAQEGLPSLPQPAEAELPSRPLGKATWIWNTADLTGDPGLQRPLLDFLLEQELDHVFLQLPEMAGQRSEPGEVVFDFGALRPVVADLNALGIRVYALDGAAWYALPGFHQGVLRTVDHVIEYNRSVPPNERFYGIRYDIEPYLLPGFHGPDRAGLIRGLLELTAASVQRAHEADLVFGADIPFWYDTYSEESGERYTVLFGGTEKRISEHIIDLVDDVAIMDYRTVAYGADGTIRHGTGELEYAEKLGKRVFIGLETHPLPDEALLDFSGEPGTGLPDATATGPTAILGTDADSIFVALFPDPAGSPIPRDLFLGWLGRNGLELGAVWWWPIGARTEVPAGKLSFAGGDLAGLERVMRETAREFLAYRSFAGFAIHHAESFRMLIER